MPRHTLYIITYSRGAHPLTGAPKPHHWAYFLDSPTPNQGSDTGTIFQLRGMPGSFSYPGPEPLPASQHGIPGPVREKLEIGEVEGETGEVVGKIDAVLKGVVVVKDEGADWNCQDWVLKGLEGLRAVGVVWEGMEGVGGWLREREREG